MAKGVYACIDGVSRNVKKIPVCIDGVSRNTKTGYACIDGVSRQFFSSGTPISTVSVGGAVYMKIGSTRKSFTVIHQGRPSTMYDSSCNGTWLMMRQLYTKKAFDGTNNDYANSDIHAYLNSTFLNYFESGIRSAIKQVKIPYQKGTGSGGSVASGSNGLSTKIFLLSCCEVDDTLTDADWAPADGACLSYFQNATDEKRRGSYGTSVATAAEWWLRSPRTNSETLVKCVSPYGYTYDTPIRSEVTWIRPVLILPSTMLFDDQRNIIA